MDSPFLFDAEHLSIVAVEMQETVPTMKVGDEVWFCAKPCARILGYTKQNTNKAINKHVDEEWRMPLSQLLKKGPSKSEPPSARNMNDLTGIWIMWSGLLELCTACNLPMAKRFKKWVYGEVLPAVMQTGSYSIHSGADQQASNEDWNQERMDGIHLYKMKNASIKELIASCFGGQQGRWLYSDVGDAINKALLDFNQATKQFKKDHCLPGYMSIPSLLDFKGQTMRKRMEQRYKDFIKENWTKLQESSANDIKDQLEEIGKQMREGNRMAGYTVQVADLMRPEVARAKARDLSAARKRGLMPSQGILEVSAPADKKQRTLFAFGSKAPAVKQS